MDYLTLAMNLKNLAISQYINYNFNSFAEINGTFIGFNEDGIFDLDNTQDDDNTNIDAFAELVTSDWGIPNLKRIRKIRAGYEAAGDIRLILTADEGTEQSFTLAPTTTGNIQTDGSMTGRRIQVGRHWKIKIENTLGCDFSLDTLTAKPVILFKY